MHKHETHANLWLANNPVINHRLSQIRDVGADKRLCRDSVRHIAQMMCYGVTANLQETTKKIVTPVQQYDAPFLAHDFPVIVPILRAGLAMADGLEDLLPESTVAHVGMYRDHDTLEAIEYLNKLPDLKGRDVILVDPMLATGNSAQLALDMIKKKGADMSRVSFLVLLAAPEGVKHIYKAYPDVKIFSGALDEKLNENAYIVPGLGDAGDRSFGTE
jgi:uracil phosphoribosyltransferase